jgi:hypothetical protein
VYKFHVAALQREKFGNFEAMRRWLFAYNEASNYRSCHRLLVQGASQVTRPFLWFFRIGPGLFAILSST